ncbi:hypothetical protein ACRN98_22035 [Shewanella oncorhynchi]|uniref:hypothetical protein n=1 Tax=Shewanella TaxID=22 RepID=UPI0021D89946|nr:hypothetical protein [Shewanella sp. SM69]MCU8036943.1 hypothetical protein [Shewanella sp. SM69]
MKFTSKDSTDKLIKYAAETLGLDLSGKERQEVIAEMKKADASLFPADKPKAQAAATAAANDTANNETDADQDDLDADLDSDLEELELTDEVLDSTPKGKELVAVTLNIHDDSGDEETEVDNFVQVGVNGVMHQVQKGIDVKVSAGVYEVLNNAIEKRFKTVTDAATKMKSLKETQVKRWPFSVIQKHYA